MKYTNQRHGKLENKLKDQMWAHNRRRLYGKLFDQLYNQLRVQLYKQLYYQLKR